MASVYTDLATSQLAARTDYSQAPNAKQYGGTLRFLQCSKTGYTAATADPLYVCRLPKGARLIPQLCSIDYGDPGDACTGKIGYFSAGDTPAALDDDAYTSSLALGGSAGRIAFDGGTEGSAFLTPVQFSQDVWIVCTWTTVTNGASHTQTWNIAYTVD